MGLLHRACSFGWGLRTMTSHVTCDREKGMAVCGPSPPTPRARFVKAVGRTFTQTHSSPKINTCVFFLKEQECWYWNLAGKCNLRRVIKIALAEVERPVLIGMLNCFKWRNQGEH